MCKKKASKEDQVPGSKAEARAKAWAIQDPVGGCRLFQFRAWDAYKYNLDLLTYTMAHHGFQ